MENEKLNGTFAAQEAAEDYAEEAEVREPEEKVTEITLNDDRLTVAPVGRLDTVTSAELKERIDSREGRAILPYAESLGLGSCDYELVEI